MSSAFTFKQIIRGGKPLKDLGVTAKNGRFQISDLRLVGNIKTKEHKVKDYTLKSTDQIENFKGIELKDIDFANSDFSFTHWTNCFFHKLSFTKSRFNNFKTWGCSFDDVVFSECVFTNSLIGGYYRVPGVFTNVTFVDCTFENPAIDLPKFMNCKFENCRVLGALDFNGSQFENCSFAGELKDIIFRGQFHRKPSQSVFERKIKPSDFPNQMINVDFSRAEINGVRFMGGVDLSKCIFPSDNNKYLLITDNLKVFTKFKMLVESEWEGEDKRIANFLLEKMYLTDEAIKQKMNFISKKSLSENIGKEFANKFFDALTVLNR